MGLPPLPDGRKWGLLVVNFILTILGAAAPFLLRLYFLRGGRSLWLSSLVQVGGWPLLLIPLAVSFLRRGPGGGGATLMSFSFAATFAGIGVLIGVDSYMYAVSSSLLPASTNSILSSTQLAFVAVFSFLIVRQRFTACSTNAVVVLTLGAAVLAVQAPAGDRPAGESTSKYAVGFATSLGAAALYALTLPLTELMYRKFREEVTYRMVVEVQLLVSALASAVCIVGMLVNGDFQAVGREARESEMGEAKFYVVLLGPDGHCRLLLLALRQRGAGTAPPVSEIAAVLLFHERFDGRKGVALALSLWGFASFCYGELTLSHHLLPRTSSLLELELPAP
ncbi:unnamed protein product [Spirodela intermedia]|uniref:Probable purine permease n=1 Tax=Spirodela intermedia TaxID=51605 RepID=A0A7I8INZ8_SPIIN|nr:unnamed protein product [Spirodela intermedia]CAA6658861.1 unnamed protein product [Spirodela intermedia]